MKEFRIGKKTRKALIGALASKNVMSKLYGKEFVNVVESLASCMDIADQLTFWNLINVRMNPKKDTHIYYGQNAFHPTMIKFVDDVCKVMLNHNKEIR